MDNKIFAFDIDGVICNTTGSDYQNSVPKLNAVKTVYEITGQYDISVIIRAPSITEINAAIDELRKIPGVIDTNTVIILRTIR